MKCTWPWSLLLVCLVTGTELLPSAAMGEEGCVRTGPRCHQRDIYGCCVGALPSKAENTRPQKARITPSKVEAPDESQSTTADGGEKALPAPSCDPEQHLSSGHCCPVGHDWSPAEARCFSRQSTQENSIAEATTHQRRGMDLYRAGDFASALEAFEASQSLAPLPENVLNIALCQEQLGHMDAALQSSEQYLAMSGLTPTQRSRGLELRERLEARQSGGGSSEPTSGSEGHESSELTTVHPVEEPSTNQDLRIGVGPWVTLGSGLALALAGGILYAVAYANHGQRPEQFDGMETLDEWVSQVEGVAIGGDVLMGIGAATLVAGLVWLLIRRGRRAEDRAGRRFQLGASPLGEGGLALEGRATF